MKKGFAPVFEHPSKETIFKLSAVFALIYFFSPNGIAGLPAITVSFLLKDVLHMSATGAAYFGAVAVLGWVLKPLWGVISDIFPLFGFRRKSYLIVMTLGAALVWSVLGSSGDFTVTQLLVLFTLSSVFYSFMDVLCDALMVETGKREGLTARFQSIQWSAVYIASIITAFAGGYVATHWRPDSVFMINAAFPLLILAVVLFLPEIKRAYSKSDAQEHLRMLKENFSTKATWLLAFFIFFVAFSPSFGAPFFYFSVDTLHFDASFLGIAGATAAAGSAVGAFFFSTLAGRFGLRRLIRWLIVFFTAYTLLDLVYFLPVFQEHLLFTRYFYVVIMGLGGFMSAVVFLAVLTAAAERAPTGVEGSSYAAQTAFWNLGVMGSGFLGGYLFELIGLIPLIITSAVFTAAAYILLPYIRFAGEKNGPAGESKTRLRPAGKNA